MEKKTLVAVAAALMSSLGALPLESARAADAAAAPSAYEDSSVDASLDPGEERISAAADNQSRLKELRYAYFIGYNARAREDSKSYANLGDEVKHPQKPLAATPLPASPKPVAERTAPARRVAAVQAAPLKPVAASVAASVAQPKRVVAVRAAPPKQVVARAEPVPLKRTAAPVEAVPLKHVSTQVETASLKHVSAPVESAPPKRVVAQVASLKPVSTTKRVEAAPVPLKEAATRPWPAKLAGPESEPPILVPTQAVAALPDSNSDNDDAPATQSHDNQNVQRPVPQYRQPQQYAAPVQARAYSSGPAESQESGEYAGREYAPPPPPPRTVQANQYAPAQYQAAYGQSDYVPRPPAQAVAQRVVVVGRPAAYQEYNQMYTPPELRRPYPSGYGNSTQNSGYQGWE
jgi:hypothetical protein